MAFKDQKRPDDDGSWFNYQASKFKPKQSYPDSKMKVYTKPEPPKPDEEIKVEETSASDSMIVRVIKAFKGES